jgi:hypothetical protein
MDEFDNVEFLKNIDHVNNGTTFAVEDMDLYFDSETYNNVEYGANFLICTCSVVIAMWFIFKLFQSKSFKIIWKRHWKPFWKKIAPL